MKGLTHLEFEGVDCCSDVEGEEGGSGELVGWEMTAWVVKDEQSSVVLVFDVTLFEMLLIVVVLQTKRLAT